MASQSVQRAAAKLAGQRVDNSQFGFILRAKLGTQQGMTYLVSVPQVLMRRSVFAVLPYFMVGSTASLTKLGWHLAKALNSMNGVETAIDEDDPYLLDIHVTAQGFEAFADQMVSGIPRDICIAIETALIMNRGPLQCLAEFLRRLF